MACFKQHQDNVNTPGPLDEGRGWRERGGWFVGACAVEGDWHWGHLSNSNMYRVHELIV